MSAESVDLYNYDAFIPDKFSPWMRFGESPPLGSQSPDYPLWTLEREAIRLHEIFARHRYTIVEFGSFT